MLMTDGVYAVRECRSIKEYRDAFLGNLLSFTSHSSFHPWIS